MSYPSNQTKNLQLLSIRNVDFFLDRYFLSKHVFTLSEKVHVCSISKKVMLQKWMKKFSCVDLKLFIIHLLHYCSIWMENKKYSVNKD